MPHRDQALEDRILVLAPTGADAGNVLKILETAGFQGTIVQSVEDLCAEARSGAGTLLVAEEAIRIPRMSVLVEELKGQPSWSDLPLVLITTGGDTTHSSIRAYHAFGPAANLTLVERPFRAITLISTIRTALRSRRRQYEVRGLLDQLEERVRERTTRLEQTISELEAFSYSVSHDLRAPLRAMRGYSEVLLNEYSGKVMDETATDFVKRVLAGSERLDRLVQDVLRYSRCAREKIECAPVDLETVIAGVVAEYPAFHPPKAEVIVAKPLLRVRGHEASLTQAISNILGNAVKFVRPERSPKVKIWTEPAGQDVKIFFNDNGIGIEPNNYQKIFRMFERAAAGQYEGTGIGLAIVAKAVERMCGKVGVESVVGRGSTFWIELPAA